MHFSCRPQIPDVPKSPSAESSSCSIVSVEEQRIVRQVLDQVDEELVVLDEIRNQGQQHICSKKHEKCPKCLNYKFKSGKGLVLHQDMTLNQVLPVSCGFEVSKEVLKLLLKKPAYFKLFQKTDKKQTIYFALNQNQVKITGESFKIWFKMIVKPDENYKVTLDDLASSVIGQLGQELDEKIKKEIKKEDILVDLKVNSYQLEGKKTQVIKLRMPFNSHFQDGDLVKITPDSPDIELKKKRVLLFFESKKLVTLVEAKNKSKEPIELRNSDIFGVAKLNKL